MSKLLKALIKTRTLIRKGWTKGSYCAISLSGDCYCLVGALRAAGDSTQVPHGSMKALGFKSPAFAINWNDNPATKKSHVLRRLSDAIDKLKAAA